MIRTSIALFALALPTISQSSLIVADPIVFTDSTLTGRLDCSPGNPLLLEITGAPNSAPLLVVSGAPASTGAGSIGGIPIGVDLASAVILLNGLATGQALDASGSFGWGATPPLTLPIGASLWSQALTIDMATFALDLTNTVQLNLVPVNPSYLPLLAPGKQMGMIYSDPKPSTLGPMDTAWAQCISSGVSVYELALAWTDIEASPGIIDTTYLASLLQLLQTSGLQTYLSITTIDTVNLSLPSDLTDPANPAELAPGLSWDSPAVTGRFAAIVDAVAPLLTAHGGFFLCVGNEVDGYLSSRPLQVAPYAAFVDSARARAHLDSPQLALGVSMTLDGSLKNTALFASLASVSDNVPITYYPLNPDFTVRPPTVVAGDLAAAAAAAYPLPFLLQEYGYPSGYTPAATNGSSLEKQRQFVESCFAYFASEPRVRMASLLHLGDWDPALVQFFATYYGISGPLFAEYLGTLGLHDWATGTAKPAYAQFLLGLSSL